MTQVFTGPPTITTHPTSQLTSVDINVTLDCEGTGRGSITYQWETSNINGGQWANISDGNSKSVFIENLTQSQQYRCVVSNEAGSTRSNVATVTVLSKLLVNIISVNNFYFYISSFDNSHHRSSSELYYCCSTRRCCIILFSIC